MKDLEQKMAQIDVSNGISEQIEVVKDAFIILFAVLINNTPRSREINEIITHFSVSKRLLFNVEDSKEDARREDIALRLLLAGGNLSEHLFRGIATAYFILASSIASRDTERHIDNLTRLRDVIFRITDVATRVLDEGSVRQESKSS